MSTKQRIDLTKRHSTKTRGVWFQVRKDGSRRYCISWKGGYPSVEGGYEDAVAFQAQLRAGSKKAPIKKSDEKTFEEVAVELLRLKRKIRESTADGYASVLNRIWIPRVGSKKITSFTVDSCAQLIRDLEDEGLKGRSITKYLVPFYSTLDLAARRGYRADNPWLLLTSDDLPDPGEPKPVHSWSDEDADSLIAAARARASLPLQPGSGAHFRSDHTDLIVVSLYLGLRQGEVLGLQWQDIDLKDGVLYVNRQWLRPIYKRKLPARYGPPKTAAGVRRIPLAPDMVEMFRAIREKAFAKGQAGAEYPVFATRQGKPLSHRNVSRAFAAIRADAGLDVKWHDMRDFYASRMIARGTTATALAVWMGHADASITMKTYAKLFNQQKTDEQGREAMSR